MPGNYQLSPDLLAERSAQAADLGLGGVILFGIPDEKDAAGSDATSDAGIIAEAVRAAKPARRELLVITDVCFCEYTDHGHCGPLSEATGRLDVDNDATLELLARQAVVHARAGADMVAPSGMMDGMVGAIRARAGRGRLRAPADHELRRQVRQRFLRAVPRGGRERAAIRRSPRLPDGPGRRRPARRCGKSSSIWPKGPTSIMVKPALPYLDIIRQAAERFPGVPLAAYNVSGEFSMVKAAARHGWLDEQAAALESLTAIRRAGAGIILTYWAKDAAGWLG